MIGVYFMLPILFSLVKYKNGKYLLYMCILFFVFGILIPTLRLFQYHYTIIPDTLEKFSYELVGYSGYFLLGHYLSKLDFKKVSVGILFRVCPQSRFSLELAA